MGDIYVKPNPDKDYSNEDSPLDQVEESDPKPFGFEQTLHDRWGWYPFIYKGELSLASGLGDDELIFPQSIYNIPALDLLDIPSIPAAGPGGGDGDGDDGGGDDGGLGSTLCTPPAAGDDKPNSGILDVCKSVLSPCEFGSYLDAAAATGLDGKYRTLATEASQALFSGDGSYSLSDTALWKDCGDFYWKLQAEIKIQVTSGGIFCSPTCTCVGWSLGAGFLKCVRRKVGNEFQDLCTLACRGCGTSGHGCATSGTDWSGLFKSYANCLKAALKCMNDTMEAQSECANCNIDDSASQALDPFAT